MKNLITFEEFLKEERIDEKVGSLQDQVYDALDWLYPFRELGADQQGELVKLITKQLNKWGIK